VANICGRLYLIFVRHVGLDADGGVGAADSACRGARLVRGEVGDGYAGALGGEAFRRGEADPGGTAGDERDAGGQRPGPGHPLQLGRFERPVLNPELLALRDGVAFADRGDNGNTLVITVRGRIAADRTRAALFMTEQGR
jgi:hypothetical protein